MKKRWNASKKVGNRWSKWLSFNNDDYLDMQLNSNVNKLAENQNRAYRSVLKTLLPKAVAYLGFPTPNTAYNALSMSVFHLQILQGNFKSKFFQHDCRLHIFQSILWLHVYL